MKDNMDKCDQELLTEAYSGMIKEAGDMDSHLGIASGGYQREPRPEDKRVDQKAKNPADLTLEEHLQGLKTWFSEAEQAHVKGDKALAVKMLKNIAGAIATIRG